MLAPGKLEHVFTILNSTWKRVNEALDATQSWNELRCPSQSCNARCSPQRSREHRLWQFLLAVTTAPQELTTWANARCQELLWLAQDHLAWRLRGSPTPWTELLEGRHHCLWADNMWYLGVLWSGTRVPKAQWDSVLGSGDVWDWIPPNPGTARAPLALPKFSRQVDISIREQATFQSNSHFPPLLGMGWGRWECTSDLHLGGPYSPWKLWCSGVKRRCSQGSQG